MLRIAFVDDCEAAKGFATGDIVRKTDFRGFFPSPYAGRVVYANPLTGTVQVQWPWGSEQEHAAGLIKDLSGDTAPADTLNQTYSSWEESVHRNGPADIKADEKWRKQLLSKVASLYETHTLPIWRAACRLHHAGKTDFEAFKELAPVFAPRYGAEPVRITVSNIWTAGSMIPTRLALYWKDHGRRYKVTQQEKDLKKFKCPRCSGWKVKPRAYRQGKKVLQCRDCGFSVSPKDLVWGDDESQPETAAPLASTVAAEWLRRSERA